MDSDTLMPTEPTPAPAPVPAPDAPPVDPLDVLAQQRKQDSPAPAAPAGTPDADPLDDLAAQRIGARRAILTTSMIAAVRGQPEREAKIVALNDQLGMAGVVDAKNYDEVHQHTRLQDIDFPRLLSVHPELASWLSMPGNAAIAHDEVPQLQQLSSAAKSLTGIPYDVNGVLPDGFKFRKDGTIRGPLYADGTEPRIYRSIDELRDEFSREATRRGLQSMDYDRDHGGQWFPNVGAGLRASIADTLSALGEVGGSDRANRREVRHDAEAQLSEAALRDPTLSGGAARIVGSLIGDAPLYLLGGEVAGAAGAIGEALTAVKAATALPAAPASAYLADVWKTAVAYSPVGARSGINTGAENGAAYGSVDFLINTIGPAAFGSKLGLAKAIVPGEETAAAAAGWNGVAGRFLAHVGSQGGIMATTELANAIHEYATGVNPNALDSDQLLPRLGKAGAMGALLSGAFHLLGSVGEQIRRRQVAANAAMMHGDRLGALMEAAEALKTPERSSARFEELLRSSIPDDQRTKFYQGEDFEGIAKAAGMKPEDLAAAMNVSEEYKLALATGKTMTVPTADLIKFGMSHEDPVVKQALLTAAREHPNGININDAVQFYKETPDQLAQQKLSLETDVTKAATEMRETDPIYQDMMGKVADTGRPIDEAKADAKLMAARFNTLAARWNAGAEERGAKRLDPLEEYQAYQLSVQKETPGASGIEPLDAMINRVRKGDIPTQRQAHGESLVEFLSKRGLQDVGGELRSMGVDEQLAPGRKKLIDPEGWGLDIAAERAHDQGFIESPEPNALLAAIAEEHAGRPAFAFGNEHPQLAPLRQMLIELQQLLKSKGIDVAKPNTEIKQALAGNAAVARFEQPVLHAPGESLAFEDLVKQWRKANGDRSPVEGSSTWKQLVREAHKIDLANGKIFHQPGEEGHRGSIEFDANRHFAMTLTGRANLSTVLHESGHFWLETMGDYAEREGAPKQMKDDYAKVLNFIGATATTAPPAAGMVRMYHGGVAGDGQRWFTTDRAYAEGYAKKNANGNASVWYVDVPRSDAIFHSDYADQSVDHGFTVAAELPSHIADSKLRLETSGGREGITREMHERFARAIEQYLMEGHAPSAELRGTFQRFAIWLADLYKQFKALVNLTPEVRGVFDRLLATDEAIEQVQKDLGSSTIFKDQASSGMSDQKWGAYLNSIRRERERMQANVFAKAMAVLRKENTKTYHREKSQVISEAAAIVKARPVNVAVAAMAHGLDAAGNELDVVPKLDRREIEREYGRGTISKLPRGITADAGGMSLTMAAEAFGFRSGEELWTALANYQKPTEAIRALADQIMQARHPEMTADAMHEAAMDAVHANNGHADILSQESAALAIHALKKPIPQEQFQQIATRIIDDTNYRDLNPNSHLRAEVQSSDASTKAFLQLPPDYTGAFLHKQREELSHALYRASLEAQDVVEKTTDLMKRVAKTPNLQMLGHAGGFVITGKNGERLITGSAEEAAALAKEYEGTTETYLQAMQRMIELWEDKGWRYNLDFGELRDFSREAAAIQHQAKTAFEIIVDGKRVALEETIAEGLATERATAKGGPRDERPVGAIARIGSGLVKFDAVQRSLSFVCRQMDGEKNGGWHWNTIDRPLTEAAVKELAMNVEDAKWWKEHVAGSIGKADLNKKLYVPSVDKWLSHGQRLQIALNVGSTKNLRRLMEGERWTREQVTDITNTLTREDWKYVTGIWAHLRTKREPIFALEAQLYGLPPEPRDSLPIETPFGTIDGDYFPMIYDPTLSAKAGEISMERIALPSTGMVHAGFTKKTVERTDLRLLLDSRVITRHLADVSHYLSHAEVISNLNKLLRDRGLTDSMIQRFGNESFNVIRDSVRDAAQGMLGPQTFVENILHFVRTRSGAAIMGFNAMSGASQIFGASQSMERVGVKPYMAAVGEIFTNAMSVESTSKWVMGLSDAMRLRGQSQYLESLEQQAAGTFQSVPGWFREHAYWVSNKAQWLVDLPTWVAAYRNAAKEFPGEQAKAVALADAAVFDTQGSGFLKDQSKIQRMNELGKLFMQFGSFFNKTYQLARNRIAKETTLTKVGPVSIPLPDSPASIARLAGSFMLLVSLPTVSMSLFREAVKPSKDDDGSPEYWAKHLAKDHLGYLLSTMVLGRELSGMLNGFDYSGPAGLRTFSLINQLGKQIGQGEADHGLARAALLTAGSFWGMPAVQLQRIIDGILYNRDNDSANPLPLIVGPPQR